MTQQFHKRIIPNKIPPDYKRRVLQRLLPSQEEILSLDRAGLEKLVVRKNELEHLVDRDPVRFFTPNPGGQGDLVRCFDNDRSKIVILLAAGNKHGKTTGGAVLTTERMLGKAIWGRETRDISWPTPCVGMCYTEDFETHAETILPNLYSWCPKDAIKAIRYNNQGQPGSIEYKNGSILRFKTYAQGIDTSEGKDWDWVWFDEPPPRALYTGVFRGLVSRGGKMVISATLIKEAWIFDEGDLDHVMRLEGDIHSNLWISEATKDAFLATLSDEEREVRELGKPLNLVGLIYKHFHTEPPFVIPDHPLPDNCPYIIGVDPHERRPLHIEWGYIDPFNRVVWFDWALIQGSTDDIKAQIKAKESKFPREVFMCVMDPNRGKATQINGLSWEQTFLDYGYDVILGQDNLAIGHTAMYDYLTLDRNTKRPSMCWTDSCRGYGGPIYQMSRYSWDNWANNTRHERDQKEKPRDKNKDFPDIHRYVAMERFTYDSLYRGHPTISAFGSDYRPYGRVG